MLEEQCYEMQQRHEEEQQSLLCLQEVVEAHYAKHVAQKARREAEAKAKEEAEKWRIVEEKKKLEYIQWLWDKVLEKEATLLEEAEGSQVAEFKHKEIAAEDEEEQWPSKKAKGKQQGKYHGGAAVKMGSANPCKMYVCTGQDCLVHPSRWVTHNYTYYYYFFNNFFFHSCSLAYARCIAFKQQCVSHTNTNTLAMIPTYSGVLSAIEKALQKLVEKYWGVGRSLQDLVEG